MRRITMSLPFELAARVEDEARRRRQSVSELIRECLVRDFGTDKPRRVAWAAVIDDAELPTAERFEEAFADEMEHASRRRRR